MPALEGKSAVVTGASSGIGAATALAIAHEGARVIGGARRTERISSPITALELDVTDPDSCERFVKAAVEELDGIDILVNAAGLALGREPFDNSNEEDERTVLETNVNGLIRMTRLCLPHIRDGGQRSNRTIRRSEHLQCVRSPDNSRKHRHRAHGHVATRVCRLKKA